MQPEVAMYFATTGSVGTTGALFFFEAGSPASAELFAETVLVMAPPQFSRIQRQSGYFLCGRPGQSLQGRFKRLEFRQVPGVPAMQPTWLWNPPSATKPPYGPSILLDDPLRLEAAFQKELPAESVPPILPTSAILGDFDLQRIRSWTLPSYVNATGHAAIQPDGRIAFKFDPALLYAFNRFSPTHGYLHVASLIADRIAGRLGAGTCRYLDFLLEQFRRIVVSEDPGISAALLESLDDVGTVRLMARVIGSGDRTIKPYPLSEWYQ
jgi:hypothetical protein